MSKSPSNKEVVAKLRRLADALEEGTAFEIQIAGQRISVRLMQPSSSSMSGTAKRKRSRSS